MRRYSMRVPSSQLQKKIETTALESDMKSLASKSKDLEIKEQKELEAKIQQKKNEAILLEAERMELNANLVEPAKQFSYAKLFSSCDQISKAKTWLQHVVDNKSEKSGALTYLAKWFLKGDLSLKALRFFHDSVNFTGPFTVNRDSQGRTYIHCKYTHDGKLIKDVILVVIQNFSSDQISGHIKDCEAAEKSGKGPIGLAVDPEIETQKGKYRIGMTVFFLKAQLLFDEAMRLLASRPEAAYKLFQEASKLGHTEASLQTAEMLLSGRGIGESQPEEALQIFRKLAEGKDAIQAKYRLACVLSDPTTRENNPYEAITIFEELGKAGHIDSCYLLGRMHLEGDSIEEPLRGTAETLQKAMEWVTKAVELAKAEVIKINTTSTDMKPTSLPIQTSTIDMKPTTKSFNTPFRSLCLLLANIFDLQGKHKEATSLLAELANSENSFAQLNLAWRYTGGIGLIADPYWAGHWINRAAKDKVRPIDNDPAVLVAKALIKGNYTSAPPERLDTLFRSGRDFVGPISLGTDSAGRRTIECTMLDHTGNQKKSRIMLVAVEPKEDDINRYVNECISGSADDPTTQPMGVVLDVDLRDEGCGLRESIPFALIMPAPVEEKFAEPVTKEVKEEQQRIVIMRSGHHTNNWLSVMGDIDRIMPTLLKYLNRDWKRDIAERNSGLEWLPQRLHLSLGKPTFGDVYVGKIGVGCCCWMYVILSTPPPTLRPEIHTVFPVIVAKARKYYLHASQILEWHNRIEATIIASIDYTTDDECKAAIGLGSEKLDSSTDQTKIKGTSSSVENETPMSLDLPLSFSAAATKKTHSKADDADVVMKDATSLDTSTSTTSTISTTSTTTTTSTISPFTTKHEQKIPVFAIDFVSRRNIWEGKGPLEVFLSGIAAYMIRNPQESLRIPQRKPQYEGFLEPGFRGGINVDDDDSDKKDTMPRSVVCDLAGPHGKTLPWSQFQQFRGIMPNEGPRKENRVAYVQGICQRTVQLPGMIWGKGAYMVTIRVDEARKIDLDVWCLLKHMIDGRATIVAGEYMSYNAGSIPVPGDLVFTDVWIHGTIATGLDPVPTTGTEVTTSQATLATSTSRAAMDHSDDLQACGGGVGADPMGRHGGHGGNGSGPTEDISLPISEVLLDKAAINDKTMKIDSLRLDNPDYDAKQEGLSVATTFLPAKNDTSRIPTSQSIVSFFSDARKHEMASTTTKAPTSLEDTYTNEEDLVQRIGEMYSIL